jgi:archaellum component FlaF (FlaF/FlaG flagellin family)
MKKITGYFALCMIILGINHTHSQARVQVIHNCADLAVATVDVYLNNVLLLDNFAFRTATPFIDAPSGIPLTIQVKGPTSTVASPALYTLTPTLTAGSKYILVADGVVSATGYAPSSATRAFQISVYNQGREAANIATKTDVLVHHGSTDAPTVDVNETSVPVPALVNDISYPSFAGYLELTTANYTLTVTPASGSPVVASYSAPLQTLGLAGKAITVLASGFLNPAVNSNGPAFGLWVALNTGGALIPLPSSTARVQVIHNCADLAASTVDVYLNNTLLLDNFAFRNATPFIDAPAGVPITLQVKGSTSTVASPALYTLTPTLVGNSKYILVADGIVSATGYTPNSATRAFQISVYNQGREAANIATKTDVLVHHGSTDAPTVDVNETSVPVPALVNDISYPSFAGYLELTTANYTLNVTPAAGSPVVATYSAPLATLSLQGKAITVLASGFLNPTVNSNGPAFGLWVALNTGGALIPLPVVPLSVNSFSSKNIELYPNPVSNILTVNLPFTYEKANYNIVDLGGRSIKSADFNNQIDVSSLSNGMYILNLGIDGINYAQKIIVSK